MSKYDFQLDLSQNTSTGSILSKIKKGSTVLEFGCATGRMTRYMQQELDCRVYIVEYDADAYETARQYACDGLCDDATALRWAEKFSGVEFDAIIIADVLEHLPEPEKVVRAAAQLLKEDGCIHISVPNITHNDILLKACSERFDYTATGLLDDTHVHFWGFENLKQLAQSCGLFLQSVEGTYCRTGETEQHPQLGENSARLENILRLRPWGEAYQFVICLSRHENGQPVCRFRQPTLRMYLYLDTGNDFNSKEVIPVEAVYDGAGAYCAHMVVSGEYGARRLRLDPAEYQDCIVEASVMQNGIALPLGYTDGIRTCGGMCLFGNDPMIFADVAPGDVTVDLRIILPGPEFEGILEEHLGIQKERLEALQAASEALQAASEAREKMLSRRIADWETRFAVAKNEIGQLGKEKEQLQADLCSYIVLANNKEKYILTLEKTRDEQTAYIQTLEQMLRYRNTLKGLLRGLIAWALRKAKGCVRRITGRRNTHG